jgi:hypothetical protein
MLLCESAAALMTELYSLAALRRYEAIRFSRPALLLRAPRR